MGGIRPAAPLIIAGTLRDHRPGPLPVFPPFPESPKPVGGGRGESGILWKVASLLPAGEGGVAVKSSHQIPNARIWWAVYSFLRFQSKCT